MAIPSGGRIHGLHALCATRFNIRHMGRLVAATCYIKVRLRRVYGELRMVRLRKLFDPAYIALFYSPHNVLDNGVRPLWENFSSWLVNAAFAAPGRYVGCRTDGEISKCILAEYFLLAYLG